MDIDMDIDLGPIEMGEVEQAVNTLSRKYIEALY